MAEITEIMPDEFTDKAIKEALEEKKILDAVESGDQYALDKVIFDIMRDEIESDTKQTLDNSVFREEDHPRKKDGTFTFKGQGEAGSEENGEKVLTDRSKSDNIIMERRTYKDYEGNDVEFETTKANWKVLDRAKKNEPAITEDVVSSIEKTGAKPFGVKYRLKSPVKAVGKIARERKEKKYYEGKSDSYILSQAWDNVRYSQVSEPENLKSEMYSTLAELEKKGHKIEEIKNYFNKDNNAYDGINVKIISPNKQRYELQFNTQKNFGIKEERLHPIYDLDREEEDPKKHEEYQRQMFEIAKDFDVPEGIRTISMEDYLKGGK